MKLRHLLSIAALLVFSNAWAATELIAPGTTQVDSADITAPFSLYIKPASGNNPPPSDVAFLIQKKNSGGAYNTVATVNAQNISQARTWSLGVFRVERQASTTSAGMDYEQGSTGTSDATAANQVTGNTSLATIATNTTGVATAANQTTANTSLSTIATNTAPLIYAQGSATSGQSGNLGMASVTTSAPTYTNGQTNPLSLTTGGAVRADLTSILGTALQVNNGVANSGVPRVVVGSSNSALPAWGHGATAAAVPAGATYAGAGVVTSIQTAASSGNLIGLTADHNGQLLVSPHPRELTKLQATSLATTGETTVVTAGASGVFNDITDVLITTAGTAAGTLAFKDATAGTTIFTINYPDAALAPAGQFEWKPARPIAQTTAANNWTVTASNGQAYNITILYDQTK